AGRISSSVGAGFDSTSDTALTICPGVQKPHCNASARTNESTIGWSRRPSIVVIFEPSTACASVMHDSVGTPSTSTVHAPQWPSPHATFVPVSDSSSRSASASVVPTSQWRSYAWPLTSSTGDRLDVRDVHEPVDESPGLALLDLVFDLRHGEPEVARGDEQLLDAVDDVGVPVALGRGVDREPEHADRVGLSRPEQRDRHREVL